MTDQDYFLERFRSLIDRALAFGPDDWTVEFKQTASTLLEEMRFSLGRFGECEVCKQQSWRKPVEVSGGLELVCAPCRHEDEPSVDVGRAA